MTWALTSLPFPAVRRTLAPSQTLAGALCLIALYFCMPSVFAQTNTGQIKGVVRDKVGALIPGATVSVRHLATGVQVERVSDSAGQFLFPSLPVGECEVSVSATGFSRLTRTGIDLRIGQVIDLVLTLEIGEISAAETITTSEQLLATATSEVSEVIGRDRVVQLRSTAGSSSNSHFSVRAW